MLEGGVCKAEYVGCGLNCPRPILSYWHESWLDRVEDDQERRDDEFRGAKDRYRN
jgi:hypothetical protein